MKLSRKVAAAMLAAALTLSLCVISALPGGQPRMDAMTYNIDTLPARDLRPVVDGPETEADYTPPAQAIHTTAQEEAAAEVSAEAPAPEAPAQEKTESAASAQPSQPAQPAQPSQPAQPASSTSVLAVGVTADSVRLRAAASTGSAILAELNRGTTVSILGRQDGWYRVNYDGKTGYMSGDYLTLAAARPAAPAPAPTAPTTPAVPASGTGAGIAALARSFVGKAPYVYGGAGPAGFDCSGFTMYIYGQFGIRLPHGATDQMRYGAAVDRSQLQPGDLIFFHDDYYSSSTASHCGIYVGNDQFVHASTYGSGGVLLTALNGNPYYSAHYIAARRMG